MSQTKDYAKLQRELEACLQIRFPDAAVQIGDEIHYKGPNIVVTSSKFAGLLAEQRFHHVVRAIPKEFYEKKLQKGFVWFELAPGEKGIDLMRMPRSTDLTGADEAAIRRQLDDAKLFKKLASAFEGEDDEPSGIHFGATIEILKKAGLSESQIERCCLYMILKGAYCDAHVVNDLLPKMLAGDAA